MDPARNVTPRPDASWWIFASVVGFFLCCYLRVLTTGYLELDDLGRVQIGYNLWALDGRLLTAALMKLFTFSGRMVDMSPLPQLGAVALMGAAGVLLSRAAPELGVGRTALSAILLFATPFYLQNMTYVFDSLSMTASMTLALGAVLLATGTIDRRSEAVAATALLAALLLYQPAVNVFLCFGAGAVLFRLSGGPDQARHVAWRSLRVLTLAATVDAGIIALLRVSGVLVFPSYQAQHAALPGPWQLVRLLPANVEAMLGLAAHVVPPSSLYGVLILAAIFGFMALALTGLAGRGGWRQLPLFLAAAAVLLTSFAGPMLLLRDPVVQPRALLGVGAMLASVIWYAMRMLPMAGAGRVVVVGSVLLVACFARYDFAYGALLRDLDRYEAAALPQVARDLNAAHATTGLDSLQILGAMPYPTVFRHGLERVPGLGPLFENPLNGISWLGVALLAQYGLEDGIRFRDAEPAAILCRSYRETGPGYSVGESSHSLVLIFRGGCP